MVYLFLADGFEEIEALCPLDILRRGGVDIKTVGISGKTVTGAHGIAVVADILPDEMQDKAEMLIFPGGMPGSLNLDSSAVVSQWLENRSHDTKLAAICAAPLVLGRRGLLGGVKAVCYPGFENELKGHIPSTERVVTDGQITTAVGMGAAAEFGFALLAQLKGQEVADQVAKSALFGA